MVLTLLAIVVLTTPLIGSVQACRPRRRYVEKIPVTQTSALISVTEPTKTWTLGDKFVIDYGVTFQFASTLNLPDETLEGISDNSCILRILNVETDTRTVFTNKVVWTYPGGTFEGKIIHKQTNVSGDATLWEITILYCVLHGTGTFEGQTMILEYDGPFLGAVWTGFIYK